MFVMERFGQLRSETSEKLVEKRVERRRASCRRRSMVRRNFKKSPSIRAR